MWHASGKGRTTGDSRRIALDGLRGVGDPDLGQWVEEGLTRFTIGGETFATRYSRAAADVWDRAVRGDFGDLPEKQWIDLFRETISAMLEPEDRPRWAETSDPRRDDPLTIPDMTELLRWLFAEGRSRIVHVQRRLSADEREAFGVPEPFDIRGTPEELARIAAVYAEAPYLRGRF